MGAAVASALAQTSPPHEVIVCDDGSTDDTESALAGYRDRITLLRKENGGGASALNHAARAATGELVAILDSDDVYDPRRLEAIRALAAERPDLDIIATDAWLERDGERAGRYFEVNPFDVEDQRSSILSTCYPGGWPALRRERLLEAGGFDESYAISYDWECWLRLIHGGSSAGAVDEPLMTYRIRGGSLSANPVPSLRERLRLFERAAANGNLRPHERRVARRSIARDSRRLAEEEIGAALVARASAVAPARALRRPRRAVPGPPGRPPRRRVQALTAVTATSSGKNGSTAVSSRSLSSSAARPSRNAAQVRALPNTVTATRSAPKRSPNRRSHPTGVIRQNSPRGMPARSSRLTTGAVARQTPPGRSDRWMLSTAACRP